MSLSYLISLSLSLALSSFLSPSLFLTLSLSLSLFLSLSISLSLSLSLSCPVLWISLSLSLSLFPSHSLYHLSLYLSISLSHSLSLSLSISLSWSLSISLYSCFATSPCWSLMSVFVPAALSGALFCPRPLFPNHLSVSQDACAHPSNAGCGRTLGVSSDFFVSLSTHKKFCEIQPLDHQDFREDKHSFSPAHKKFCEILPLLQISIRPQKFCEILPLFQISIHLSSVVWTPDLFLGLGEFSSKRDLKPIYVCVYCSFCGRIWL